jgi:SAM-dependent methyltransferase
MERVHSREARTCPYLRRMDARRLPPRFFARADPSPDTDFYGPPRLVTHIDDDAIAAVGALYEELGLRGAVLDLMASWISHFRATPERLVVLGLNAAELEANDQGAEHVVRDLNATPALPFPDASFDGATCCVSVDYLVWPLEVFAEVARVLRPGAPFAVTFSNRCFPTKAIRGWLEGDDADHVELVHAYFGATPGFGPAHAERRPEAVGDPLFAVWARREDEGRRTDQAPGTEG